MPILRYQPGDAPPRAGKYRLVDHWGEDMNLSVWCSEGERLPVLAVAGFNRLWFVQMDEAAEVAQAA